MWFMVLQCGVTFAVALAMTLHVLHRRERTANHWLLVSLMAALMVWTGGLIAVHLATDREMAAAWLEIAFLGALSLPIIWVVLAARLTGYVRARPAYILAAVVPSAISYLGLVTNEGHRLFATGFALHGSPVEWGGPLFWVAVVWSQVLVMTGIALYLRSSLWLVAHNERLRGATLAVAALVPLASNFLYLFGVVAPARDVTPLCLGISVVLLFAADFRYRILDTVPLARRDVVEHLREGVIVTDAGGQILDANPAAEELFGQKLEAMRHRSLHGEIASLFRETDPSEALAAIETQLAGGEPVSLELPTSDDRWFEVSFSRVHGQYGRTAGLYTVLRDRTERHRYERFLQQSQRLETVAVLSAGIAHEVNNPLAYVRSNLTHVHRLSHVVQERLEQLGEHKVDEIDELRLVVEETMDGVDRITNIIDRMRRFSRDENGEFSMVDVNQIVVDSLKMSGLYSSGNALQPRLTLGTDLGLVAGCEERLAQVVLNLIVNARQALAKSDQPELDIETLERDAHIEICVSDNGPGIPPALRHRIFDPCFTTKSPGEGTGLGLSIAYDIVREHGGRLRAEPGPERGSRFTVELPLAACEIGS
ncbi:MAG: ATP-binding protein [Proteobacteria bacterium]|nr:ATP-binding protein [Pseudomonadota bacterium]